MLVEPGDIGKSNLLGRYAENEFKFEEKHLTTIGVDFRRKIMKLKNGKTVKLTIWELASQERFRNIAPSYLKNALGIILLYDITDLYSFERLDKNSWISMIKEKATKDPVIYLVGNKIDIEEKRVVSKEMGEILAMEKGFLFSEISAKTGYNVNELFEDLAERIYNYNFYGIIKNPEEVDKGFQRETYKKFPKLMKYTNY